MDKRFTNLLSTLSYLNVLYEKSYAGHIFGDNVFYKHDLPRNVWRIPDFVLPHVSESCSHLPVHVNAIGDKMSRHFAFVSNQHVTTSNDDI